MSRANPYCICVCRIEKLKKILKERERVEILKKTSYHAFTFFGSSGEYIMTESAFVSSCTFVLKKPLTCLLNSSGTHISLLSLSLSLFESVCVFESLWSDRFALRDRDFIDST